MPMRAKRPDLRVSLEETEDAAMGNELQARAIERYHRHLERLGRSGSIDDTARAWVARYAVLWRQRYAARLAG
jgi:hypothetical protein